MPVAGAQTTPFNTSIHGWHSMVVMQSAVSVTDAPPQMLVPVTLAVLVMLPQKPAGTLTVEFQGLASPTAKSPTLNVVSSPVFPGVPLLSVTTTPESGTFPQLVTIPSTA